MKKKLLFIFNPCSGKGQIKNKLMEVIDIMVKAGYEVTIHSTQDREDAMQKVKNEAKNYDLGHLRGGDGTLDEAVTGRMQRERKYRLAIFRREAPMILPIP